MITTEHCIEAAKTWQADRLTVRHEGQVLDDCTIRVDGATYVVVLQGGYFYRRDLLPGQREAALRPVPEQPKENTAVQAAICIASAESMLPEAYVATGDDGPSGYWGEVRVLVGKGRHLCVHDLGVAARTSTLSRRGKNWIASSKGQQVIQDEVALVRG